MSVLLLATFDTKREETEYISRAMESAGLTVRRCDISLNADGAHWSPEEKLAGMDAAAERAIAEIAAASAKAPRLVVAIGGGTGGQIALKVLHSLPAMMPKLLVTTLPFDPRYVIADNAIVLVPTIADLCGLNATTRDVLDRAAAIAAGLRGALPADGEAALSPSIGVTSLGVTGPGTDALRQRLTEEGHEVTVFHANGFGGAAFTRWAEIGAFQGVVDYTPHELTRCHVAGIHAEMPNRFTGMGHLPRVVVPGAVNVIGLGEASLMPDIYRARPHYAHSPLFTHVQCSEAEITRCAEILGAAVAASTAPQRVLIPMGGFSSEDRPGGAVESPALRHLFADTLEQHVPVTRLKGHINDAEVAHAAADALAEIIKEPWYD